MVQVKDHRQRFLGIGFYNSKSKINVRLLDRERVEIDTGFFERRVAEALALRRKHLPGPARLHLPVNLVTHPRRRLAECVTSVSYLRLATE